MEIRAEELRCKEVICVADGSRLGFVGDMEIDLEQGQIRSLIIPCHRRLFGLLGREPDRRISWENIRRFGDDIILVEDSSAALPL